ncbi:hypothetical protein TNCV_4768841 [Trichonephila clavipes]|nr:hypothetical protein TNCV_4768841 [Trichonephila clavipes]
MIGTTFRDRKIQQTFPLEDAAWMFWQNQNGGKALIGSEVLQKTGRSKKFILTLKSLTLKKKDSHFRHQFETNKFKFFNDVSSFGKIVRIMAYVLRFCNNLKKNRIDPEKEN